MNLSQYMLISVMVMKIMYLHFSQTQITLNYIILTLITLLAYFAVSRNANLFVHERLTNLLHRTLKCTFRKENFLRKKMKNLREENFCNHLLKLCRINFRLYGQNTINSFLTQKTISLKFLFTWLLKAKN